MKSGSQSVIVALLVTFCVPAYADQAPEEILRAITRVLSIVPENARTAPSLGTKREGNVQYLR